MTTELFLDERVTLHCGDCLDVLATLAECSIDSCVTDSPYGLEFMGKEWDAPWQASSSSALFGKRQTNMPGFGVTRNPNCLACGGRLRGAKKCACETPAWDESPADTRLRQMSAFQDWCQEWAEQIYRVLKPGGYLLAFGGTRTYHRLACAIEDAGFEVRDMLSWLHGQGFPKNLDVSKAIDKEAGAEREVVGIGRGKGGENLNQLARNGADADDAKGCGAFGAGAKQTDIDIPITRPATDAAREWAGWGTALKPALEPICMARKPLSEGTVAANVLKHGAGAINIDGCRVEHVTVNGGNLADNPHLRESINGGNGGHIFPTEKDRRVVTPNQSGRWPANVIHDGSEEVTAAFPETASGSGDKHGHKPSSFCASTDWEAHKGTSIGGDTGSAARFFYQTKPDDDNGREGEPSADRRYTDEGATDFAALPGMRRDAVEPSRLFYTAKADKADRLGSKHPTVKPVNLLQYLVRLVTPPGGVCLDPFAGTGTTGEAAWREGMRAVLIEREEEYQTDIRRRMALAFAGPMVRKHESVKAKSKDKPVDHGPLFRFGAEDE